MPVTVNHGLNKLYLTKDFSLNTKGSNYSDESGVLSDAFSRFIDVINSGHVLDADVSAFHSSTLLQGLHTVIHSSIHQLQYGVDESYKLFVPSPDKSSYAYLEAHTVYGALHGLQTLSQLCHVNLTSRMIELGMAPWNIADQPRFSYRGLMIDTARHYQPLPMIKKVIDAMAYSKLNVLHWHIVDTQSFPLEIPSYPKLWDGAYSASERYTIADATEIVSYAEKRGINVLAEVDVPGHALSWGVGYPELWPSRICQQPLDVSNEFTFKVIDGILSGCWSTTPHIKTWLKSHRMNESQAYQYFVLRAQQIASSHGYEFVNWEETFNNFGDKMSRKTVVHNWLVSEVPERATAAGFRCIVSNQGSWYLDHLDATWEDFYMNEPLRNITNPNQQKLIMGGEVCMWGETVDASDIEQTIWPRAAAAAERLWTAYDRLAKDPEQVFGRLARFRCLLTKRGVAAGPVSGSGRAAPLEPERKATLLMLLLVQVIVTSQAFENDYAVNKGGSVNLWPMPVSVSHGNTKLHLSKDFALTTQGSNYTDKSGVLRDGFSRFLDVVKSAHVVNGDPSSLDPSSVLQGLHTVIRSPNEQLQYGVDESYKLMIPSPDKTAYAYLEAQTVYGALHGLQTFSQLCYFSFTTRMIEVGMAPWNIVDQPRFSYRGLLIAATDYKEGHRFYGLCKTGKYPTNVLHWHIVDKQAFPLEIPSYPKLWDGAYSISERYTMADATEIVSYAERRGINVLAEVDVPGHALSWGVGYPELWPSKNCPDPLDISNEFTFKVIDGILSGCWTVTPHVKTWLQNHRMNETQAYEYFIRRAQKLALSHGYEVVNWEETFEYFGNRLSKKIVVHNWLGGGVAEKVTAAGLRCIVSDQYKWYLDHLDRTWQEFYMYEPLTNITNPGQQKLVIGGEVCMWGETVDASDIEQTIWPRAAAAAERLWTSFDKLAKDPRNVTDRLTHFRCILTQRGIAAAPLYVKGREAPYTTGSCYDQ
ncbi:hypothetical protein ACFE04_007722 [Oxalis oulophora]